MGEDPGTWVPRLHVDWQSPNLNSFDSSLGLGKPNCFSAGINSGINMTMENGELPLCGPSDLTNAILSQSSVPHAWFYCLPRFRQIFMPAPNFTTADTLRSMPQKNVETISPCVETSSPQKELLVVDQSGDQTTFIFRSGFGSPIQCFTPWDPKLESANMFGDTPLARGASINDKRPISRNELEMYQRADVQSEMHEDTAEINALLYSDEDGFSVEDDEVTSTGHSPSTMTKDYDKQELVGENTEEVASSFFKSKKRKLFDDVHYDAQLMDTASSLNFNKYIEHRSDAESICGGGSGQMSGETGSLASCKRKRTERVRDILSVLQSMIPGGKDKDPIVLLDEAIHCLKSLKVKAKLLGLDTF